jgi:molybdate transport system substrate-binding protein
MQSVRSLLVALVIVGVATGACGDDDQGEGSAAPGDIRRDEVTVFAAASLTGAFTELGDEFAAVNPDIDVTLNFASSSDLVAQIGEGAPADVFASADEPNMARLTDGAGTTGVPAVFATNRLEIIVAPGNPHRIVTVADLAGPDLIVVTAAPEVPIGRYADEVLARAGVEVTPKSLEENVKAIVTKVVLGEADAGIVYATDVRAAGSDADGVEIPVDLNVVATYPIAVPAESPNPGTAAAFIDFVLSPEGQATLASFGFGSP